MTLPPSAHLLRTRRFLPLFAVQFLGALNDNLFKHALVVLVVFRLAEVSGWDAGRLSAVAAGLFVLPFFLFSATAGQLADKHDKARLIRIVKAAEIVVMALGVGALAAGSVPALLAVLFLMSAQSTFFGPLKYGILPDHLTEGELIGANALIEAGTFLAILFGTIAGGLLVLGDNGVAAVSAAVLVVALAGYLGARFVPPTAPAAPGTRIDPNLARATAGIVRHAFLRRDVRLAVLGGAWFWVVGSVFLAHLPVYVRDVAGGDETVLTAFLALFSIGVGVGSMLCERLTRDRIDPTPVPYAGLGMAAFAIDLWFAGRAFSPDSAALLSAGAFLAQPAAWRVALDLVGLAACAGIWIVPLYALIQHRADPAHRSQTIAANNVVGALGMTVAAGLSLALLAAGLTVEQLFLLLGLLNLPAAWIAFALMPAASAKALVRALARTLYRAEVRGLEHWRAATEASRRTGGPGALAVANHLSFLDGPLLAAFLDGNPLFAVNGAIARRWWFRPFTTLFEHYPIDPGNPFAAKSLIARLREGRHVVIFPEGRITVTGSLMKVYDGTAMIADRAGAAVVPIHLEGPQHTPFARLPKRLRRRGWFAPIRLRAFPAARLAVPADLRGAARRRAAGEALYDLMSDAAFQADDRRRTLFEALLQAAPLAGRTRRPALQDALGATLSHRRLAAGALALGRALERRTSPGERVGLLLANAVPTAVTLFALQATGRVPAMLNFGAGPAAMTAACRAAGLRTVLTSRRFLEAARLGPAVDEMARDAGATLVFLEDLRPGIGPLARLRALATLPLAPWLHRRRRIDPDGPAVVLFTSGSEGTPKGVVLSHANLLANCRQVACRIDFGPEDIAFNALPLFHSFGLTGGLLLPLLAGAGVYLYPSPLHYRVVPEAVYASDATVLFGTDTFLAGYAKRAHPYDFRSLRYAFAGAERLREETRRVWADRFGVRVFEGYGATETAPVLALNTPMHAKPGTVGRLLPGIEHRIEPVPGIADGGRLHVRGPNVMLGYLRAETPGALRPPPDGWYDTGDVVTVSPDGFVTIKGRAKRFAKIAGEMVSLAAVEALAESAWPGA
ncbi:MAG TPA: acyl-[ACP]--phospholipid O-acyltransferase, partial [Geminicoccaceae bacterium]|nr:acyl-[ACP]--phospholipid O-acyltransferase [Geminicoccaceae bacterium]